MKAFPANRSLKVCPRILTARRYANRRRREPPSGVKITMKNPTQASTNPYPFSDSNKRYYTYDCYLRRTYGKKCRKIPLDGGFTCPNRDGKCGVGGCAFCSGRGSGDTAAPAVLSIYEQYKRVSETLVGKWGEDVLNIPYFQAYTGTYAPLEVLREKYEAALELPNLAELCIATRADCLEDETLLYLESLSRRAHICIELGLQSIHDETARLMNRGHDYAAFLNGYSRLHKLAPSVDICVHLIFGLPGEDRLMMLESVKAVAALHPDRVKLHLLHVLRGTKLAEMYASNDFKTLSLEEYVETVADSLELLPPDTVICRLTGDGLPDELIAPEWSRKKLTVINDIDKLLFSRDSYQGKKYLNDF